MLRIKTTEQTVENSLEIIPGLTTDNRDMIIRMIESGVDEKDIPFILGVDEQHSIASWENLDPKIRHFFDKAREVVLNKVENSLLKSALGGTLKTVKTGKDKNGNIIDETTIREVGPNVAAAERLLRLFRPNPWANLGTDDEPESAQTPNELGEAEVNRMKKLGGKFFEAIGSKVVRVQSTST